MSTSTPLPEGAALNPRVLQWARRESGWAPEDLADKLKVKRERFASWESGERAPTLRQVENVARQLHRPLNLFFLPEPPSLPPLAAEYRRLTGVRVGAESPQLRLALRQMLNRRDRVLDLIAELGADQPSLPPAAQLPREWKSLQSV